VPAQESENVYEALINCKIWSELHCTIPGDFSEERTYVLSANWRWAAF